MLPVLLLPGTLCTGAIFDEQATALAALAPRVEVVEFRHEQSIDEMAATAAKHIFPDSRAALVGFSMGGMVALALARRAPESIGKIALLNSNHHGDRPERRARRLQQLATAADDDLRDIIEREYLPRYLHHQKPGHRALILDMACELGMDCLRAQTRALAGRPDGSETLERLRCPTLILGSDQDSLCPPAVQIEMHGLVEHSDLVLLGDCGHFSPLERPQAVSRALCSWYLEQPRAPGAGSA
jgi:pimeloyl-ACP methyl ester carboxylesterase